MEKDKRVVIFTEWIEYWRFLRDVEYDVRVTKDKEIWSKNELIAKFKPK